MTETNAIDCSAAADERRALESSVQPAAITELVAAADWVIHLHDGGRLAKTFDSRAIEALRAAIQSVRSITAPAMDAGDQAAG